jgi:ribulose-phosphate 3-epimerase
LEIAPSILSMNFLKLAEEFKFLESSPIKTLHLDVMDGHFVPNLTFGPPFIAKLRSAFSGLFEAHLMVSNPEQTWKDYRDAGCDRIIIHPETAIHPHRLCQEIRSSGAQVGLALNPGSSLCTIEPLLEDIDLVLLMTVNPGFGGQSYIHSVDRKIKEFCNLRGDRNEILLEIDGGVKVENIGRFPSKGVDLAVVGSAIFNDRQDSGKNLKELMDQL